MALTRTLTRKLQKLNRSVRSRASSIDRDDPLSKTDGFYSISFEQTAAMPDPHSESDNSSISSAADVLSPRVSRNGSSSTAATMSTVTSSASASQDSPGLSSAATSAATTPAGIATPGKPTLTTGFSRDLLPLLNQSATVSPTSTDAAALRSASSSCYSSPVLVQHPQIPVHVLPSDTFFVVDTIQSDGYVVAADDKTHSIRQALARDKIREADQDAKADAMAMSILEKVTANDYVQELDPGSWKI